VGKKSDVYLGELIGRHLGNFVYKSMIQTKLPQIWEHERTK
jgi:hypothetical protein